MIKSDIGIIFLVLLSVQITVSSSVAPSKFKTVPSNCNHEWKELESSALSGNLLLTASMCSYQVDCIGWKRTSGAPDRLISKYHYRVRCKKEPILPDSMLYLRSSSVRYQPELSLVDLGRGKLVPVTIPNSSPFQFPSAMTSELQIQFGEGLVVCHPEHRNCQMWTPDTNAWASLTSLNVPHIKGAMSILDGQPIVIGGSDTNGFHNVVEILSHEANQWVLGPPIEPGREHPTALAVNETSVVVIGGNDGEWKKVGSVQILRTDDMIWHLLPNYPMVTWYLVCGLLETNLILCVGGRKSDIPKYGQAYGLRLSADTSSWERYPIFDTSSNIFYGFLFRIGPELFCISIQTEHYTSLRQLRRMILTDDTPEWEVVSEFPTNVFYSIGIYVTFGFNIEP